MSANPPPNKRLKVATVTALGSLWETTVFSFLDTKTLVFKVRGVNQEFRRAAGSLVQQRILGHEWSHTATNNDMDDHLRHVTLSIRNLHTKNYSTQEDLVGRAVQTCEKCWESKGMSDPGVYEYLRFITEEEDDDEREIQDAGSDDLELNNDLVRNALQEKGALFANEGYGWEVEVSFTSKPSVLEELIQGTPFEKNPFSIVELEEEDLKEKEEAIFLARCMKLLLEAKISSSTMGLAKQKCLIYHPDFDEAIAYSGTENCLQFMVTTGDGGKEVPLELFIRGEMRSRDYLDGFL
ncbi:expressed unknown protein [Seminavis robusta]|uniref:Uncharacterized protein n=1 Tax=Seminavis robusta TaxID=568900 RepID=A0A9N8EVL0_9STRA|nr:expressed unknown protein [Seminavis robusta]|eukprot:Sro1691_g291480.1 n/a (295) ;mRNA; f:22637-23521